MVMHSRSGGNLEVMGLLLGKVDGNTMIVMDSFALPVEGTETRVNAQAQAYEYMAAYTEAAKQVCIFIYHKKYWKKTSCVSLVLFHV
jgi:COP9 signalosome complex subunit 5